MAEILDGKAIAEKIKQDLAIRATEFERKTGRKIGLAVIRVGADPASAVYVRNKIKACERCNIRSLSYELDESVNADALIALIHKLNKEPDVDGILVQLPLPKHIDERVVLSEITPDKDADGFHAVNAGKLFLGEKGGTVACTPRGIIELIKSTGVPISGKHAVVVGRSNIVGKPVAMLLLQNDATVTVCHSRTQNLKDITLSADILVAAVGKSNFITADMVKRGAIVIDVGMNRTENGLCGDVDFYSVKDVAGYITPVPGGVGPMTVAMLLCNTVDGAMHE
ncbi:MAG: bifunctional methylenetetrahydrofolate dehydrogenase/methenyltetrahydrofolate cyclohydrolase FolD [Clostridiales bacterium]|nr:bifunctional methylenetetrahydrofolate dehydrogenase/methenyltetrahydrofolate cyclohydrolase FolD [Clostridiales bacterium]